MKFKYIQVLRGIAASLVVFFHLGEAAKTILNTSFLNNFFKFGYLGVDIFFVLSGFIITFIHYKDLKVGSSATKIFIQKRFVRIFPFYWVVATFALILYVFFTNGVVRSENLVISFSSFSDFVYLFKCFFLISQDKHFFIGPAWTLSYELLFYFVFAAGIICKEKVAKIFFFTWIGLIVLNYVTPIVKLDFVLNTIILEFLFGCFSAYLFIKYNKVLNTAKLMYGAVFFTVAAILYYICSAQERNIYLICLIGISVSLQILYFNVLELRKPNLKVNKYLVLLGDASYSLYLIHGIMIGTFVRVLVFITSKLNLQLTGVYYNIMLLIMFFIVSLLSVLVHKMIERPLIKFTNSIMLKSQVKKPDFLKNV